MYVCMYVCMYVFMNVCMSVHQEFNGLLRAGTFVPAPAYQIVVIVINAKCAYTWKVDEHDGWLRLG